MKNYYLLFIIIIIFNYFIKVYSENSNYIITIQRKTSDKNYDDKSPAEQKRVDEFVNDKMNDVYDVIIENKDTYGDDNKLEELDALSKRKRDNNQRDIVLVFKNRTRPNRNLQKRSLELTNSGNSTVEYITIESNLVKHVCPVLNTYAISAYLSDEAAEIVCKMDKVIDCVKSTDYKPDYTIYNNNNINENENENNKENITENNINNKTENIYYDIEAIKKETNWSDVSFQQTSYDFNYLSLISQSPFIGKNTKDENFYYPSSAGQGIDIYFLDQGLIVNHEDFDTYERTPDERTITCDVIATYSGLDYTDEEGKKNCQTYRTTIPDHGIMVSSSAGGKIYGVSKKANLHMIAIDFSNESILNELDYVSQYGIPHKTIVSMSLGGEGFKKVEYNKLKELIQKNIIIFASAGNEYDNCCGDKYSDNFRTMPGYRLAINVGATESSVVKNGGIIKAGFSNYGDCVDIHAPGYVVYPDVSDGSTTAYSYMHGTSCATPLVAGVAASIMSEHPEIQYDNELMRKTLIEMSIKNAIVDLPYSGSSDTPNRFLNNGKRSIYSQDEVIMKCGVLSDNVTVSCPNNGCCSREGKCIYLKNDHSQQCYIENGCQSEYGYCSSMDKAIEECKNEIEKYSECQIDISSDMDPLELANKCEIHQSEKCYEYYKLRFTNNFICSNVTFTNNTLSIFVDTFDEKKYYQYSEICLNYINHLGIECMGELEKYNKCFIDNNYRFSETTLEYLLNECNSFNFDECFNFYDNISEILNEYPSCSSYRKLISKVDVINNYEYHAKSFKNIYCARAYNCENELKEYEECQIDITKDMEDSEVLKRCNIINSQKCQSLSNLQYDNESSCYSVPGQFELDYGFNSDHYSEIKDICYEFSRNYMNECISNLNIYKKCFINDLNKVYNDNPNSPILSMGCTFLKSEECIRFFENPYKIINDIPSCSMYSDPESNDYSYIFNNILYVDSSIIQNYNNIINDICNNININENYEVDLCIAEFEENKECQNDISMDMNENDLINNCKNFNSYKCDRFYRNLVESKCSEVKDQFEFTKNFTEEKYYEFTDICNSLDDKKELECKNSFIEYEKCFNKDLNELSSMPYSSEFIQGCIDFKSEECNYFYDNIEELINENPSCTYIKEMRFDEYVYYAIFGKDYDEVQEIQTEYLKICENVSSNNNKTELCEKELKHYNICQIDISSNMKDEEIAEKCEILDQNICKEFYNNLIENNSACSITENQSEFLNSFNQEKYDQYKSICESLDQKYGDECKNEFSIYNKCFEIDSDKMINREFSSEEINQICLNLKSDECIRFYSSRKTLLKEIPSCYFFSELFSPNHALDYIVYREHFDSIHYHDTYMEMCDELDI
eukprot:jgi/Orpsp1_1/1176367/evm.model.c7180000057331.1